MQQQTMALQKSIQPPTVHLDANHPGFCDQEYKKRRNHIASLTTKYQGTIASIPLVQYTKQEHAVWSQVVSKLVKKSQDNAYQHHLDGLRRLQPDPGRVPQLRTLSKQIMKTTGFRMAPVAGLVEPKVFLQALGDGVFLSTQYIRHSSQPGFTPEPDIIHEIIGHAPQLINPVIAQITREIGKAAQHCDDKELVQLERLYWFTIEYGLCKENGVVKAYGAGNLSSFNDIQRCLSTKVAHRPFDIRQIIQTPYDPTQPQPVLFVVESFEEALQEIREFLSSLAIFKKPSTSRVRYEAESKARYQNKLRSTAREKKTTKDSPL